jgi:thiol-disulfide isomerase/thioredoxin
VNAEAEDPSGKDYSTALAQIKLTIPADPSVRNYLGLKRESGQISLSEVNADILIIEIFNMYCPYCQLHAPMANKLYQTIRNRKDLKDRVKLIGIGISNSPYEVNIFRQKYSVLFPLFDDKNGSVLDAIPEIRTPHYFAIKKGSGSSIDVFFSKQGPYKDDTIFLDTILKKSGLSL